MGISQFLRIRIANMELIFDLFGAKQIAMDLVITSPFPPAARAKQRCSAR